MFYRLIARMRATLRRQRIEGEADEEIRFHLEMETAANRARGLSPEEARRAALREFGGVTQAKEGVRAERASWIGGVWQDVRYAVRILRRQPVYSGVAIGTIALALGTTTALFAVADATLFRPLPFPHAERLVSVAARIDLEGRPMFVPGSVSDMRRWRASGVLDGAAAWSDVPWGCIVNVGRPERVDARVVTEGYLAVHGVAPLLGREFVVEDLKPGAPPVVMVSHAFWRSRLGADRNVVGRQIRYDDLSAEIVGVMPAGVYPGVTLWRPARETAASLDRRGAGFEIYARLQADVGFEEAARRLAAVTPAHLSAVTGEVSSASASVVQLTSVLDELAGRNVVVVRIFAAVVALIVLLACVNVAGLQFARGASRQAELAVRRCLGGGRLRLFRQLLVESVVLALIGAAAGVLLARLTLDALKAALPLSVPGSAIVAIDLRVLFGVGLVAVATGILSGLAPSLRLAYSRGTGTAKLGIRAEGAVLSRRGRQTLVAAEIALAVMLVVGMGLMLRSLWRLTSVELGFNPDSVVAFRAAPMAGQSAAGAEFYSQALDAVRSVPGVVAAGAVDHFALGDSSITRSASIGGVSRAVAVRQILPGYFEALEWPLRLGGLPGRSSSADSRLVAVVNESAARTLFADGAIGQQLTLGKRTLTVVGVVADVRHGGPLESPRAELFVPFETSDAPWVRTLGMTMVVRVHGRPANIAGGLRRAVERVGPPVIVEDIQPAATWLDDRIATPRHRTVLMSMMGGLGFALAVIGVFGLTAYAVSRRTREIGVRIALGANPWRLVQVMTLEAARPAAIGLGIGLVGAYYGTRVLQSFLFETAPTDPATFIAAASLLMSAAVIAAWLPARRAARIDPVTALRAE